jgi:Base plate wedge protein 53
MAVKYDPKSFYARTQVKQTYLDILNPTPIAYDGNQSQYVIDAKYANRPDRLAYDLYGSSKLYWVFAACNRDVLEDPLWDFVSGLTITVPSPESVKRLS